MNWANEGKEKLIGYMLVGGGVCIAFGLFVTFLGLFLGAILLAMGIFTVFVGICLLVGGLAVGFSHNRSQASGGPAVQQEARIMAKYAINDIGEMIFSNFDYDAEDAKFYVRIQFLGGRRDELECARPVFDQCGEGMRGLVTVQGAWLAQFVPLLDSDETKAAYRDWEH